MRSTRRRRFPGPEGAPANLATARAGLCSAPRVHPVRARLLAAIVCCGAGCASTAELHPDYASLRPTRIDVRRPVNRTVIPLEEIGFGGPLQRVITGPRVFNVPEMLHQRILETVSAKGFETGRGLSERDESGYDFRRPLPEGAPSPPFDAVLYTSIESWSHRKKPDRVILTLRAELYKVPRAEKLYEGVYRASMGDHSGAATEGRFLDTGLRRAAQRALAGLPGVNE